MLAPLVAAKVNAESVDIESPTHKASLPIHVDQTSMDQTFATPILIVTDSNYTSNPFNPYLTEILRAEGFFSYGAIEKQILMQKADLNTYLSGFKLVLLCEMEFDSNQQQIFRNYVQSGGKLVAMRPEEGLADMFGLTYSSIRDEQLIQYFAVDIKSPL